MYLTTSETYLHYKGGYYEKLLEAAAEWAPDATVVIYRSVETGQIWAREKSEFHGVVDVDGAPIQRFKSVPHPTSINHFVNQVREGKMTPKEALAASGFSPWDQGALAAALAQLRG